MKAKIALLLVATLGSAALVASAQQAAYVIKPDNLGPPQADTPRPNTSLPVSVHATPGPPGAAPNRSYFTTTVYGNGRPSLVAFSGEEVGLSHQAEQLSQQLAGAKSDSDRDKIKAQLAEILEKQFDQRQKRHEEELKELEAQVKKLKDLVDKRQENRRDIIRARLNQIEKESQGLGW
jgi:hypothetical protein